MPLTITKTVRPNARWQEMYVQVQKGQRVVIIAKGLWSPDIRPETLVWCGPDGFESRLTGDDFIVPGANLGALVGRIGRETNPFPIGNYYDFVSTFEGPLFMAMNDKPEHLNQAGEVDAQMILFDL